MKRPVLLSSLIAVLANGSVSVHAQDAPGLRVTLARAQAVVKDAITATEGGDFALAVTMLRGARSDASAANSLATLDFGLGWVLTRAAERESDAHEAKLRLGEAADAYRSVLEAFPEQPQAIVNLSLVLQRAGDANDAKDLLAAAADRADADAQVLLALGDVQRAEGDSGAAKHSWLRAAARPDSRRAAHERITAIAHALADQDPKGALDYVVEITVAGFGDLAERAAADIVSACHRENPTIAEEALLVWASLRADQQRLDDVAFDVLPHPDTWPSSTLNGLRSLARGEGEAAANAEAWGTDPRRAWIAGETLLLRAERLLASGRPNDAFVTALHAKSLAPGPDAHRGDALKDRAPVALAAASVAARAVLRETGPGSTESAAKLATAFPLAELDAWSELDGSRAQSAMLTAGAALARAGDPALARSYLAGVLKIEQTSSERANVASRALPHVHVFMADAFEREGLMREASEARTEAARRFLRDGNRENSERELERIKLVPGADERLDRGRDEIRKIIELDRELETSTPVRGLERIRAAGLELPRDGLDPSPVLMEAATRSSPRWSREVLGRRAALLELAAREGSDALSARSLGEIANRLSPLQPSLEPSLRARLIEGRRRQPNR
ncbi:MAG: hypothetical protein HZB39_05590 [Planctomycetes bacterium]|nr:hypothetical protein [Planctomycetota bacterium]